MVVDLPAPFGPTKPVTWPGWTVNVMPSSATVRAEPLAQPADFDRLPQLIWSAFVRLVGWFTSDARFYAARRCQHGASVR